MPKIGDTIPYEVAIVPELEKLAAKYPPAHERKVRKQESDSKARRGKNGWAK